MGCYSCDDGDLSFERDNASLADLSNNAATELGIFLRGNNENFDNLGKLANLLEMHLAMIKQDDYNTLNMSLPLYRTMNADSEKYAPEPGTERPYMKDMQEYALEARLLYQELRDARLLPAEKLALLHTTLCTLSREFLRETQITLYRRRSSLVA